MKIYFHDKKHCKKFMAFGQMIELVWACYAKGKELGYDNIIIEWHDKISIGWTKEGTCISGMNPPENSITSLKVVPKGTIIENVDRYIDISESNVLYDDCPPLISNDKIRGFCYEEYLERYYKKTNIKPTIEISKSESKDKYILLHYRYSTQERQIPRNVSSKYYIDLIKLIRENYKEYKIYKIGELSEFDSLVDKKFGYFLKDTDKLINLVGNSSLYIGPLSGPISIAFFLQHPCIGILSDHNIIRNMEVKDYYSNDTIYINPINDYLNKIKEFMDKILI